MAEQKEWLGKPACDICRKDCSKEVLYDAQTIHRGSWAALCEECYSKHGLPGGLYQKYQGIKVLGKVRMLKISDRADPSYQFTPEELVRWMTEGTDPNMSPRSDCG
ncbi:MAG TPA: hypothetical protein DCS66_14755 [Flavobacteriaceae bacterium]|nr:hypothetical protein [Flavobacteriaceae bacterium]